MPIQLVTFNLMRVTSCETIGSEMCSLYDTKCEGETAGSVAGTVTLLCFVTHTQAKTAPRLRGVCVCVRLCVSVCVSQNRESQ